jgi:hypothetical protein
MILGYEGTETEYWDQVGVFAQSLAASANPHLEDLGHLGLALSLARRGYIDLAVQNLLKLRKRTKDFYKWTFSVFPKQKPPVPAYVYGRAQSLLATGRYDELEQMFKDESLRDLETWFTEDPRNQDPDYRRALFIKGQNIVRLWRSQHTDAEVTRAEEKLDRDMNLGKARDIFQLCLDDEHYDPEVRLALGEVLELLESFSGAFSSYEILIRDTQEAAGLAEDATLATQRDKAFLRIKDLHAKKLLPEKDLVQAWVVLKRYHGKNPELLAYVKQETEVIRSVLTRYCRGCGRKAADGETFCVECGRRLPTASVSTATP